MRSKGSPRFRNAKKNEKLKPSQRLGNAVGENDKTRVLESGPNSNEESSCSILPIDYGAKPIHRCNTFPLRAFKQEQQNSYQFEDATEKDDSSNSESEDEKYSDIDKLSSSFTKQNYLVSSRKSVSSRAASLPTSASFLNVTDITRLQAMYDDGRGKGKKRSSGNRGSIGKSMLNRLTKKLTSTSDYDSASQTDSIECSDQASSSPKSNRVVLEVGSPSFSRKNHLKLFDRKGSAPQGSVEIKNRSSRMGQRIKRTFTNGGDNLLHHAIIYKDAEMLDKLLVHEKYQEEINYLEPPGVTVFHQACVYGDFRIVQLLVSKGADVTLPTWTKFSPLKIAAMFGHFEIAEFLLKSGADPNDIRNGF